MPFRIFLAFLLLFSLAGVHPLWAHGDAGTDGTEEGEEGFGKPYDYEREAYGYDPEGVDYKQNQAEDFQVVFITSIPFTALASYGITGLVSLATRNSFDVGGDYFLPFLGGVALGSTTIACVSVLTNKYPPPASAYSMGSAVPMPVLALQVPLVSALF